MEYLLIKQPWVDLVKREHWFRQESVPYPVDDEMPAFLHGAYFIPEFRIREHEKSFNLILGAYEAMAFARLQLYNEQNREVAGSQS